MPAYNFKACFSDRVMNLEKPHTIRPVRKRPTVAGDTLYLYTGMRQPGCRLLLKRPCLAVTPIVIVPGDGYVSMPFNHLSVNYRHGFSDPARLADLDGFSSVDAFFLFFATTYGRRFQGELIEWLDLSAPVSQLSTLSSQPRA